MGLCYRDYSADDVLTTANACKASENSRLQALSVACGRVRVPKASANITLSVSSTAEENSTECQQSAQLASDNGMHCCLAGSIALLVVCVPEHALVLGLLDLFFAYAALIGDGNPCNNISYSTLTRTTV